MANLVNAAKVGAMGVVAMVVGHVMVVAGIAVKEHATKRGPIAVVNVQIAPKAVLNCVAQRAHVMSGEAQLVSVVVSAQKGMLAIAPLPVGQMVLRSAPHASPPKIVVTVPPRLAPLVARAESVGKKVNAAIAANEMSARKFEAKPDLKRAATHEVMPVPSAAMAVGHVVLKTL